MEQGNIEPKKSAFRVRTKVGSSQGLRQSALMNESGLLPNRPLTKEEQKQPKKDLTDSQVVQQKRAEDKQKPDEPVLDLASQERGEVIEKTDAYVLKSYKQLKSSGLKTQGILRVSRMFDYGDTEIFATRFSPDDALLALGRCE